jgi:hypothetical protein
MALLDLNLIRIFDYVGRITGMEKWDAYDRHLNKIDNLTLFRGDVIPEGVFHLVSEIIVKHTDGSIC